MLNFTINEYNCASPSEVRLYRKTIFEKINIDYVYQIHQIFCSKHTK